MPFSDSDLDLMGDAALAAFAHTDNWRAAYSAARRFAYERLNKKPSHVIILTALKRAKKWRTRDVENNR